ncbi:MAG: bifunctional oligoribonuclease/PAP phosphatase NrnA [Ruminococcaceae bacterium]|nr:bifunctional oligoribonuclease/PAP phosphatase NrnA [Oscillospiraceae bacterium]
MFEQILELIKEFDTIIIHRHKNPDGDALGSQIGLKNILKENFPSKRVFAVGDPAGRYAFMHESVMDVIDNSTYENALAVILDTSASSLISDERYTLAKKTARIDHHIFCEKIADLEVTDTSYESCCGLITEFAIECGLSVTAEAAKSLYTGMVTDSGRFRYDSTNANTFRLASFLIGHRFNAGDIYRNLYADDFSFIRLRAQFVLKVKFTDANVAYIYTPIDELKGYSADTFTISRGMVGVMSEIRGVDIWANFTETENGVLCEIRSSLYNINRVAVKYGGGGHEKASGATLKDYDEAMKLLSDLNEIARNKK